MPGHFIKALPHGFRTTNELRASGKLHGRVITRLGYNALIILVLVGFGMYDLSRGPASSYVALLLLIPGVLIGLLMGYFWRARWDEQQQLVIATQMDWTSIAILVGYILLRQALRPLVAEFFHGAAVLPALLLLGAGIATGRLLGMMAVVHNTYHGSQPS